MVVEREGALSCRLRQGFRGYRVDGAPGAPYYACEQWEVAVAGERLTRSVAEGG